MYYQLRFTSNDFVIVVNRAKIPESSLDHYRVFQSDGGPTMVTFRLRDQSPDVFRHGQSVEIKASRRLETVLLNPDQTSRGKYPYDQPAFDNAGDANSTIDDWGTFLSGTIRTHDAGKEVIFKGEIVSIVPRFKQGGSDLELHAYDSMRTMIRSRHVLNISAIMPADDAKEYLVNLSRALQSPPLPNIARQVDLLMTQVRPILEHKRGLQYFGRLAIQMKTLLEETRGERLKYMWEIQVMIANMESR